VRAEYAYDLFLIGNLKLMKISYLCDLRLYIYQTNPVIEADDRAKGSERELPHFPQVWVTFNQEVDNVVTIEELCC